jgi:hypothetical protein
MSTTYYVIQVLCSIWAIFFVPMILVTWLRCIVHDRGYSAGLNDLMTATSIIALYMLGLPKFPGL